MNRQCSAYAKTTSQQCKNRALPGLRYCLVHTEKSSLLISLLLGAIISLLISESYRKIFPSTELRELHRASEERKTLLKENLNLRDEIITYRQEVETKNIRIKALETGVETLRDYSEMARLTFNGTPYTGGDIKFNTEISVLLDGTFHRIGNNRFRVICTDISKAKLKNVMVKYPKFPFSYYWLAVCYRNQGDQTWRDYARKALQIFEKTTTIDGHNSTHDEAKSWLVKVLSE